jgi:protein TonB
MFSSKVLKCLCLLIVIFSINNTVAQNLKTEKELDSFAQQMPKYVGGDQELLKFIKSNLNYPQKAKEEKIEGIVFVKFIINKKGKIKDPKILVSVHPLLDNEALRLVKKMPKWEPAIENKKKISVNYNLPIRFKLNIPVKETSE